MGRGRRKAGLKSRPKRPFAGQPLSQMRTHVAVLVLWHRFEIGAAAKTQGGVLYDFSLFRTRITTC